MRIIIEIRDPVWEYVWEMELKTKPISINQRYMTSRIGNKTVLILSKKYRDCKKAIALEAGLKWGKRKKIKDLPIGIRMIMEKGRSDIDAYIKIILDALQGVVYENDRQVKKLSVDII